MYFDFVLFASHSFPSLPSSLPVSTSLQFYVCFTAAASSFFLI